MHFQGFFAQKCFCAGSIPDPTGGLTVLPRPPSYWSGSLLPLPKNLTPAVLSAFGLELWQFKPQSLDQSPSPSPISGYACKRTRMDEQGQSCGLFGWPQNKMWTLI